jgi:hypothetical protein
MSTRRAHVLLPEDLLREIDALVGPRGRSSFLVETARNEVRRQKLLQFLESGAPAWKDTDKNHPELVEGAAAWVRKLRTESDARGRSQPKSSKRDRSRNLRTRITSRQSQRKD